MHVPGAATGQGQLVQGQVEGPLRGQHQLDPGRGVLAAGPGQRAHLGVHGRDQDSRAERGAAGQDGRREAGIQACRDEGPRVRRQQVQAGRPRVHVRRQQLHGGIVLERLDDRHRGRPPGPGDQHPDLLLAEVMVRHLPPPR